MGLPALLQVRFFGLVAGAIALALVSQAGCGGDPNAPKTGCGGGLLACGGRCVDTAKDDKNCGTCGHDCLGGGCVASTCQPIVLASGQSDPLAIAVDATSVYWTNSVDSGSVMKCGTSGCGGNPTTLAAGQRFPTGIAADATSAYWTNDTQVVKCAAGGCGGNPTPWCRVSTQGTSSWTRRTCTG